MLTTRDVRNKFLEYFKKQGHAVIQSSPVVPHDDPTLLFTNAGMNQFKDVFLGKNVRDYSRATTSQKCIRAGGKHNDLENVGHTKRHLTFFEMLGNFSFGDYFKEEAIQYAWELSTKVFGFDEKLIYPTVFREDDEAFQIWTRYVPKERICRLGEKDNFWEMGETGPCGPCTELYYDLGPQFGSGKNPLEDTSGERFLEFWNLVFMQFNRKKDRSLEKLPKPSVDTGAGLERVVSLIQKKTSVFEIDLFLSLIKHIEDVAKVSYDVNDTKKAPAFRVIADHLRTLSFAIADGAQPSNVERGYVLRKILRRAVRYGKILGFEEPFLAKVLPGLIDTMGKDYKELVISQGRIAEIVTTEEEAFFRTLKRGGNILSQIIEVSKEHNKEISGQDAFKLKDTYGLPLDEVQLIAKDYDLTVDIKAFEELELQAKEKSKSAKKVTNQIAEESLYKDFVDSHGTSTFIRDEKDSIESQITGIIVDGSFVKKVEAGTDAQIIVKETLFYPEMGGQVGDTGILMKSNAHFDVDDCTSPYKGIIVHSGKLAKGSLSVGDTVQISIDRARRQKIANNHTATHLLHWALHEVLGEHARQAGSVVDPDRLRFDFSHHKPLTFDEIREIESLVNQKIRENRPVQAYEIAYEAAQKRQDIKQFFGEKYGSQVRVIDIDFSKELCGGTHTKATGNIGYFRILKEGSIAAGVRRIEAVSGQEAESLSYASDDLVKEIADSFSVQPSKLKERMQKLQDEIKDAQNELKQMKKGMYGQLAQTLIPPKHSKKGTPICIHETNLKPAELKTLADEIAFKAPSCVIALGTISDDKAHIFIKVSNDLVSKGIQANALLKAILPTIQGNGGGKADFAQGAGVQKEKLSVALHELNEIA